MQKQKEYVIAETNLANFGTEIEKKIKEASAQGEKAWEGVGKEVGLDIWRIEKFKVKRSQTKDGEFYENDSYIVMNTYKKGDALAHDIHFWLGKTTTLDEAGTAAYKTVELDNFLGGEPVQHREVADHESRLFLSYFKDFGGIRILKGGIESGFRHVKPEEYRPRLLWLKGRKNVRVKEVEKNASSLNTGDVFILDNGMTLHQWNGSKAGMREKTRAAQLVRAFDSERGGKPEVVVHEQGQEDEEFWQALGGKGEVKGVDEVVEDEEWEKASDKKLFKLSDESGKHEFTLVAEKENVKKELLDSKDAFVYDVGHEIFVWLGKEASVGEKKFAMKYAQDYMKDYNRPAFLPISLQHEGYENLTFESSF